MLAQIAGIALLIAGSGEPGDAATPPAASAIAPAPSASPAAPKELTPAHPAAAASPPGGPGVTHAGAPNRQPPRTRAPNPLHPALPAANVRLSLAPTTTNSNWVLDVVNDGEVPVRILADVRLLSFDVTPRSARRSVHCELPATMRPSDDLERALVLPPKHAFRESFQPRLYCFGLEGFAALAPGAIVVARLGPVSDRSAPPELSAIDGIEPVIASAHVLEAPAIALPDETYTPEGATQPRTAESAIDLPRLKLESPKAIDADSPEGVEVPVTLRNEGSIPVIVRFRPETIGFDVSWPVGAPRCGWPALPSAPTRELFTTVPPKGAVELTVTLQTYCADQLFERSGMLAIRPFLETRGASGAPLGLRTFEGRLSASSITFVRVQRGKLDQPLVRPHALAPAGP